MLMIKQISHNTTVIALTGPFETPIKTGLEAAIREAEDAGVQHVVLNFTHVSLVDSGGVGLIFLNYNHLNPKKVRFSIVNPKPEVREVLELAAIPLIVPIFDTEEEAMASQQKVSSPRH